MKTIMRGISKTLSVDVIEKYFIGQVFVIIDTLDNKKKNLF